MWCRKKSSRESVDLPVVSTGIAFLVFGLFVFAFVLYVREAGCPVEIVDEVPIKDTAWIAQTRGQFCGFGISAMTDISLVEANGRNRTVVMTGQTIDTAVLNGSTPKTLYITTVASHDNKVYQTNIPGLDIKISFISAAVYNSLNAIETK